MVAFLESVNSPSKLRLRVLWGTNQLSAETLVSQWTSGTGILGGVMVFPGKRHGPWEGVVPAAVFKRNEGECRTALWGN
jgi:hypothetical protein